MSFAPGTTDLYLFNNSLASALGTGRDILPSAGQSFVPIPPPPVGAMGLTGFASCENNDFFQPLNFLAGASIWTIQFRAFIPAGGGSRALLSWKQNGGLQCYFLSNSDGSALFAVDGHAIASSAGLLKLNDYNYLAMSSDGITRRAYINNVEVGSSLLGTDIGVSVEICYIGNLSIDCSTNPAVGVIIGGLRFSNITESQFPTTDPIPPIPRQPVVSFFLRNNFLTILNWKTVANGENGYPTSLSGYNIYRSTNKNLEEFELVATITDTDLAGGIETFFSEKIEGYYGYGISAFNVTGEGRMAIVSTVNATEDLDSLN